MPVEIHLRCAVVVCPTRTYKRREQGNSSDNKKKKKKKVRNQSLQIVPANCLSISLPIRPLFSRGDYLRPLHAIANYPCASLVSYNKLISLPSSTTGSGWCAC